MSTAPTATGYIITIVALKDNEIIFNGSTAKDGSIIYHATIMNGGTTVLAPDYTKPGKATLGEPEFNKLSDEFKSLTASSTTGGARTTSNLSSFIGNTNFLTNTASKTGDKIEVHEGTGATILGGKQRSRHKYSRKR